MVLKAGDAVYGGYVLAREDGVVFIRGALPGEVVEVSVSEKKRDYSVASVTGIIEQSSFRVEPPCRYFGDCGGCRLQFAAYEKQVSMKNRVLADCLKRIGGIELEPSQPLLGRDFNYRHRAQFKVSREGRAGFYREGTREVVPITECLLMAEEINGALKQLRRTELSGIREIHVTLGSSLTALIKGKGFDEKLAERLVGLGFSCVAFEDGDYRGKGHTSFGLDGLEYTVSPWSFFQSNWELNTQVVRLITGTLTPLDGKRVLDLYAGGGNFSLTLAAAGAEVVAVEENPYSIKDGERNLSLNEMHKFKFARGQAETARLKGDFDIVILDPPRPGLARAAMERVLNMQPEKIVYVSCDPSTFARDLKKLSEKYDLDSVRMIDLFPHTYHVESLAFLTRRAGQA